MPRIRAESIEAHKEQTRAEILDAAESLFVVQGYGETSLGELADAVGVGRTTLYEYFKNKDELLIALVETKVPPVLEGIVTALPDDVGCLERLDRLFEACLEFVAENPHLGLIVTRAGCSFPTPKQDRMWGALDAVNIEIQRLCGRGVEAGEMPATDPSLLARAVADALVGAMDEVLRADDAKEHLPAVLDVWVPFIRRVVQG